MLAIHDPYDSAAEARLLGDAEALVEAITFAEHLILSTIARECEALRTGRLLAAKALQARLLDASRLYLSAARAARASLDCVQQGWPEIGERLEQGRGVFAALLRIELSVLAAERAAVQVATGASLPAEPLLAETARRPGSPRTRSSARKTSTRLRPFPNRATQRL